MMIIIDDDCEGNKNGGVYLGVQDALSWRSEDEAKYFESPVM